MKYSIKILFLFCLLLGHVGLMRAFHCPVIPELPPFSEMSLSYVIDFQVGGLSGLLPSVKELRIHCGYAEHIIPYKFQQSYQ